MPVTLTAPVWSADPPRKQWTREECSALEKAGLVEAGLYELTEGELIQKVGKNHRHIRALARLARWLRKVVGEVFILQECSIETAPADTPTNEPEPDVVVMKQSYDDLSHQVQAQEIRMVAEVSDSTLAFDLGRKAGLYARAGIPEYWVVDINGRRIIVHRDPVDGQYRSIVAYAEDESIACLAAPDVSTGVGDLL